MRLCVFIVPYSFQSTSAFLCGRSLAKDFLLETCFKWTARIPIVSLIGTCDLCCKHTSENSVLYLAGL